MRALALFDFDGTLTDRDTMLAFCRHVVGWPRFLWGCVVLSPMLTGFGLGLVANDVAKERMLRHFLGGRAREELATFAASFADRVDGWLRVGALERVRWHLHEGHDVRLVSASLDVWLAPWAARHGLALICTEGAYRDGLFTGGLATPNCHGPEKVRRVEGALRLADYERVYAYGDSSGDREMLAIAHEPSYRPFR
jgi:phosphatidylglycerophosphatase C